jgi:hypothetical protein
MNRGEVQTGLGVGGPKEREFGNAVVDVEIILKWTLKK